MLVKNQLYTLYEIDIPHFMLKSEIVEAISDKPVGTVSVRDAVVINGKYYAYIKVKQNEQQAICEVDNGDSGQ